MNRARNRARTVVIAAIVLIAATTTASGAETTSPARYRLSAGPFAGSPLYTAPNSALAAGNDRLGHVPQAVWLTGGTPDEAARRVGDVASDAAKRHEVAVFALYDIPHRDCIGHSAGGVHSAGAYRNYVRAVSAALRGPTIVLLEPDSLAQLDCLSGARRAGRLELLRWATRLLAAHSAVYLDGGTRGWQSTHTMAHRLIQAGVADARGFAVNVANFDPTPDETRYGRGVSALIGWKHFVIDTSRNGGDTDASTWCNPQRARVGPDPGRPVGDPAVDALLWVKHPGESDGTCTPGQPPAGRFDPQLAGQLTAAQ